MENPIPMPSGPGFREITWIVDSAVSRSGSPLTLSEQVYEWPGQRWSVIIKLPTMEVDDAMEWQAFFQDLNGTAGSFFVPESSFLQTYGVDFGTPETNGAHVAGPVIKTRGWNVNQCVLKRGQKIEIAGRMRQVSADVYSTSDGRADVKVWPHCRALPDATVIKWNEPRGVFRPRAVPEFTWNKARLQEGFQFAADEVVLP